MRSLLQLNSNKSSHPLRTKTTKVFRQSRKQVSRTSKETNKFRASQGISAKPSNKIILLSLSKSRKTTTSQLTLFWLKSSNPRLVCRLISLANRHSTFLRRTRLLKRSMRLSLKQLTKKVLFLQCSACLPCQRLKNLRPSRPTSKNRLLKNSKYFLSPKTMLRRSSSRRSWLS